MFVPVLGPGFGTQYALWFIPALLLLWPVAGRSERILLVAAHVVASIDYIVEYSLIRSQAGLFADDLSDGRSGYRRWAERPSCGCRCSWCWP